MEEYPTREKERRKLRKERSKLKLMKIKEHFTKCYKSFRPRYIVNEVEEHTPPKLSRTAVYENAYYLSNVGKTVIKQNKKRFKRKTVRRNDRKTRKQKSGMQRNVQSEKGSTGKKKLGETTGVATRKVREKVSADFFDVKRPKQTRAGSRRTEVTEHEPACLYLSLIFSGVSKPRCPQRCESVGTCRGTPAKPSETKATTLQLPGKGGRERTPERPRSSGIQAGESREKREQNNRHGQTASWVSWGKTTSGLKERSGLTRRGLASSHTYADVEWVTGLGSGRRPVPALKQEESV
ncbi:hypothetical protein RUM44_002598 [Polyplax serrata]|uniref:Uncharacterized protein n=1 Tax=Polyplax serrata TaxID=468196 RepID=A0ABR1AGQ2_POLSC